ncbi:MAG: hypothetical protein IKK24_03490, partial [Clostridia bacterium]|nr:hypothetical protein [Clostridia bacterium]
YVSDRARHEAGLRIGFYGDRLTFTSLRGVQVLPFAEVQACTSGGVYEIEKRLSQSITNMRTEIFAQLYPIGSVLTFHDSDDHSAHLGFIWERFAVGKTLVGIDGGDSDFNTVGNSGGEKEHTLAVIEMPSHTHDITVRFLRDTVNTGSTLRHTDVGTESVINTGVTAGKTGGNQPHNNMPPYIVTSFWIRRG